MVKYFIIFLSMYIKQNYVGLFKKDNFLQESIWIYALQESFLDENLNTRFSDMEKLHKAKEILKCPQKKIPECFSLDWGVSDHHKASPDPIIF